VEEAVPLEAITLRVAVPDVSAIVALLKPLAVLRFNLGHFRFAVLGCSLGRENEKYFDF
jgi:hypothetical protein